MRFVRFRLAYLVAICVLGALAFWTVLRYVPPVTPGETRTRLTTPVVAPHEVGGYSVSIPRPQFHNDAPSHSESGFTATLGKLDPPTRARLVESYGRMPLSFEANSGQTDGQVKFLARGSGYRLFLTSDEAVLALQEGKSKVKGQKGKGRNDGPEIGNRKLEARESPLVTRHSSLVPTLLRMKLVGANPGAKVLGLGELPGKSNYFIGNDRKKWRTNVPNYAKVQYTDVYPGVDLVYYGNQRQFEYDFVVTPGADPKAITLDIVGAHGARPSRKHAGAKGASFAPLRISADGDLVVHTAVGEVRFHKPIVYQPATGSRLWTPDSGPRTLLDGRFVLKGNHQVTFEIASYDHARPLIIDPVLVYSTYLGGSSDDFAGSVFGISSVAIAADSDGNAYVTGTTSSIDFPTLNAFQPEFGGVEDAFVAKLSPGGSLVYSAYLGGSGDDEASSIAVDASRSVYLTGFTNSTDFPTVNPLQLGLGGGIDAFVTKLNADGSALVYSTYLGGGSSDVGDSIAVDSGGSAYISGGTISADFPTASPFQTAPDGGVFASTNGGSNWIPSNTGLTSTYVRSLAIDPTTPTTIYAGSAGAFKSTNGGHNWSAVNTGLTNLNVRALAIDPATPTTLYAGTLGGGVFKTTDGGGSWSPINNGLTSFNVWALAIDPITPTTLYAGTLGGGVFKTTDGGGSWSPINNGLTSFNVWALAIDPITPTTLYAGTSRGVSKSINGGSGWSTTGLTAGVTRALAIDLTTPTTLYAGRFAGVYKTVNGGDTWTRTSLSADNIRSLAIDPQAPTTVYAGTFQLGVFKTTDGGGTWSVMNAGLTAPGIRALAVDPTVSGNVYAGVLIEEAFITKLNAAGSTLVYSTYLGGNNINEAVSIAVDLAGNAYVTGFTNSNDFPTANAYQPAFGGGVFDAFVTKLTYDGSALALAYSTYLGGDDDDEGFGIAVDSAGNAFMTGLTASTNFPTVNPWKPTLGDAEQNAFVTKLSSAGSSLIYSTYLGGNSFFSIDEGDGIAVDNAGNAYVSGTTGSSDFPLVNALQSVFGGVEDAFVTELDATGDAIAFSTYLGGSGDDFGVFGIAVDTPGNIYVMGTTASADFPVVNALQPMFGGGIFDAFVAKISPNDARGVSLPLRH